MWVKALEICKRQLLLGARGQGRIFTPAIALVFLGLLALIAFGGILSGVDRGLRQDLLATALWLLMFAALSLDAASLFGEDLHDGTLDQDFLSAGLSYIPTIAGHLLAQFVLAFGPTALVFLGLWSVSLSQALPLLALLGLALPLVVLRLFASAVALNAARLPGVGMLIFLVLACPLIFLAIGGQGGLLWALGLIFAPLCLGLVPICLSLSHQAR